MLNIISDTTVTWPEAFLSLGSILITLGFIYFTTKDE